LPSASELGKLPTRFESLQGRQTFAARAMSFSLL
jgi:hypothetical protein